MTDRQRKRHLISALIAGIALLVPVRLSGQIETPIPASQGGSSTPVLQLPNQTLPAGVENPTPPPTETQIPVPQLPNQSLPAGVEDVSSAPGGTGTPSVETSVTVPTPEVFDRPYTLGLPPQETQTEVPSQIETDGLPGTRVLTTPPTLSFPAGEGAPPSEEIPPPVDTSPVPLETPGPPTLSTTTPVLADPPPETSEPPTAETVPPPTVSQPPPEQAMPYPGDTMSYPEDTPAAGAGSMEYPSEESMDYPPEGGGEETPGEPPPHEPVTFGPGSGTATTTTGPEIEEGDSGYPEPRDEPAPEPEPEPVDNTTAVSGGSEDESPPPETAPPLDAPGEEEKAEPVEPTGPAIADQPQSDETAARARRERRTRDRYNTHRAMGVQQSVANAAARAGEEDGGVVSVRSGGRPAATPDLTSQIDSVAQGMTVTNDPVIVPTGPGPMIYYTPAGSPIPVASKDEDDPASGAPPGTPLTPVSTPTSVPGETPRTTPPTSTPPTWTPPTATPPITPTSTPPPPTTTTTTIARPPLGPTRTRNPPPLGPTRTRDPENPIPPEIPEQDIPITPTPGIPPSVPPGQEEKETCCGMVGGIVYYPFTSDPQEDVEKQHATSDGKVIAAGITPHHGGFMTEVTDLALPSIGMNFVFQRTYRSDVPHVSGGLLGNHWDFNYNKRIVPVFPRVNDDGLGEERVGMDTPKLYFLNGSGHKDYYEALHQQWREVENFGKTYTAQQRFRAFVTTYKSPGHEFHEIQRYIVEDPEKHPFKEHPNVRTELGETIFYVVRYKNGQRLIFNCRGQLIYVIDRNNNKLDLRYLGVWNPLTNNRLLSSIIDAANQVFEFKETTYPTEMASVSTNYDCRKFTGNFPIPRLGKVIDPVGRSVNFEYEKGERVVLKEARTSFSDGSQTYKYAYGTQDWLTSIIEPKQAAENGPPSIRNRYDGEGRVIAQTVSGINYRISHTNGIAVTLPNGVEHRYGLTDLGWTKVIGSETVSGPDGEWTTRYAHNPASQMTKITYPRGNETEFVYAQTNSAVVKGRVRNWADRHMTYANDLAIGNLLSITHRTHKPNMRAEYVGGQVRVRFGEQSVPGVPDYRQTSETFSYEPLYNQRDYFADSKGVATSYEFDYLTSYGVQGNAVKINHPPFTRPDGSVVRPPAQMQKYSAFGQLVETSTGTEKIIRKFDKYGRLFSQTNPDGTSARYVYRPDGNLMRLAPSNGPPTDYERNGFGHVTREIVDPDGERLMTSYRRDLNGAVLERKQYIKDIVPREDIAAHRVSPSAEKLIVLKQEYDDFGRAKKSSYSGFSNGTDSQTSFDVNYKYDALGRITEVTSPSPAGGTDTASSQYDARGLVVSLTAKGETTRYEFDENQNQTGVIDALGRRTTFVFDGFDRPIATIDMRGGITSQTYDRNDNVLRTAFEGETGEGSARAVLSETLYDYDEYNRAIRTRENTFQDGYVEARSIYNEAHRMIRREGPGAGATTYRYDAKGRLVEMIDPVENRTGYSYGADGHLSQTTRIEKTVDYDDVTGRFSRGTSTTTANLKYDKFGNLVSQTDPEQGTTRMWYDSRGLLRTVLADGGRRTVNTYDSLGRMVRMERGGKSTLFTFNAGGGLTRMTAGGATIDRTYNAFNQMLTQRNSITGATSSYRYDKAGQLVAATDANGSVTTNAFDSRGRLVSSSTSNSVPSVLGQGTIRYKHDGLGRVVEATQGWSTVKRAYDGIGHVIWEEQSLTGAGSYVISTRYKSDLSERVLSIPAIGKTPARQVKWQYDALGRVRRVSSNGLNLASYEYSGPDRVTRRTYYNSAETVWVHDERGRITQMHLHRYVGGPRYWTANALFDGAVLVDQRQFFSESAPGGRRSQSALVSLDRHKRPAYSESRSASASSQSITRQYTTFNAHERLTSMTGATMGYGGLNEARTYDFSYDKGRIARTTAKVARLSAPIDISTSGITRDLAHGTAADKGRTEIIDFQYDANGNLIRDGEFDYRYSAENRLVSASMHYDGGRRDNEHVDFRYDAMGRRISQDIGPDTIHTRRYGRQDIHFLYDGNQVIAEILLNRDGSKTLLADYTIGARPGEIIWMRRRDDDDPTKGLSAWFVHEGLSGDIAFVSGDDSSDLKRIRNERLFHVDESFIEGTRTRMPYDSWRMRRTALTQAIYDESSHTMIADFRRTPQIDELTRRDVFRERSRRVADDLARKHLALMAIVVAPIAIPAAIPSISASIAESGIIFGVLGNPFTSGAISAGIDYAATAYVGGDYKIEQGITAFALGYMGGTFAKGLAGSSSLGTNSRIAIEAAYEVAGGTAIDYAASGGKLSESLKRNLLFSAIGAGGARLQALVQTQAHRSAAAKGRAKAASESSEGIEVEEFDPGLPRNPDFDRNSAWRKDTENGAALAAEVETALRTQFVRKKAGKQHSFVRKLLGELDSGRMNWDFGADTKTAGSISFNLDMKSAPGRHTRGRAVGAGNFRTRIELNPFNHDGTRATATQIALTLIHEYLHVMGANERTARRLEFIAFRRLQINHGDVSKLVHSSYLNQYQFKKSFLELKIEESATWKYFRESGLGTKGLESWRQEKMRQFSEQLRKGEGSSYKLDANGNDFYFFRQPRSKMVRGQPRLIH